MENKYIAAFILHALGDTIGFKNGEWEFNYLKKDITFGMNNEILYDFISLGGINGINLKDWHVSDDTILNMAVAKGLLNNKKNKKISDSTIDKIKTELVDAFDNMINDTEININRYYGTITFKYVAIFDEFPDKDARDYPYDKKAGGNGAAMKAGPIGLFYHGENNRKRLIDAAITISKLTHNNAFGFLGGLVVALFSAFAVENIPIIKWVFLMIDILSSKKVKKYINKHNSDEYNDYEKFINYWKKYADTRFDSEQYPLYPRSHKNIILRTKYYYENFTIDTDSYIIGESGFCATIMAYDALLDCGGLWEKLVVYAGLHFGDSDTVFAIAGFLYGIVYELGDVPDNNLKYLEFKDELTKLAKELYIISK